MPTSAAHEALCRRCGRCCYEKFIVDGSVFTRRTPCPHLDVQTHLCTVYERRFQVNPRCLDVEQGIQFGVFPASCPYVRGLRDYKPSEEGWLEEDGRAPDRARRACARVKRCFGRCGNRSAEIDGLVFSCVNWRSNLRN